MQTAISELFGGKEPNKSINPDEAVAYGAAVQVGKRTSTIDFDENPAPVHVWGPPTIAYHLSYVYLYQAMPRLNFFMLSAHC